MHEQQKQNNSSIGQVSETHRPKLSPAVKLFASGFYSGYSPVISGTVGSAVGLLFYAIPSFEKIEFLLPATLLCFILGAFTAGKMELVYGHDPSTVTIDEIVGMWISLFFLPKSILIALCAFILFRILDILKPWPARAFDKKHGGLNIMLDDVVVGIYANIILQGVLLLIH